MKYKDKNKADVAKKVILFFAKLGSVDNQSKNILYVRQPNIYDDQTNCGKE
jgi:hypothetical protein